MASDSPALVGRRPIYLLADSRLLFWKNGDRLYCQSIRDLVERAEPHAAYIGAANGDAVEFYEIFVAAMAGIGVHNCHMIAAASWPQTRPQLEQADIVLIAGGDVVRGWKVLEATGIKDVLLSRYEHGAVLIGVSAGAMLLGRYGLIEHGEANVELIGALQLVPFIVDSHNEDEWQALSGAVRLLEGAVQGLGIPAGGGVMYQPDEGLEAARPAHLFWTDAGVLRRVLILPPER